MRGTHPRAGTSVLGVAGLGLVLGHWLTYRLDVPDAHVRAAVLVQSGHGYLPLATRLATVAGIVAFAVVFLGRLVHREQDWSTRSTFARLVGFQVGAFIAMEVLERATSGASVLHLLDGTILPVGILVQVAIAAVGVVLLRLLLRRPMRSPTTWSEPLPCSAPPSHGRSATRGGSDLVRTSCTWRPPVARPRRSFAEPTEDERKEHHHMQRSLRTRALVLVLTTSAVILGTAGAALAHGAAHQGDLEMEIGFGTEPAYSGQPNSAQLILVHDGKPVTDLKPGDVTVEITFAGETSDPIDMEPSFFFEDGQLESGEPGDYRGWFTPSQPGKYTFHFTGTVDGEDIDQEMTSSPKTFSEVTDLAETEFPAVNAPSNDELATRIDQEATRTEDAVAAAEAEAASANDAASSARTVGIIGVILGAIGVIAAIVAITRTRN